MRLHGLEFSMQTNQQNMRTAIHKTNPSIELNITRFMMTKNMWEYFITDNPENKDIVEAYVLGFESELGDISIKEISPYAIVDTNELHDVMPPENYEWKDE